MATTDLLCLQTKKCFFGVRFRYGMNESFMKRTQLSLQEKVLPLSDPKKIRAEITAFLVETRLSSGSITRIRDIIFEDRPPPTP